MSLNPKKVTCITINTDASFNHEHKVGGYAFYIVCDLFKIQKGGRFKNHPRTPEEAEIMCIGNAIATLLAQKELPACKWLVINTDCTGGMDKIRMQKTPLSIEVNKLWSKLIVKLGSKKNKFRHVKAHNGTPDARSWVNDWCDKEAKKWMRRAVTELKSISNEN